ncbi:MAG: DNA translocase FtsK 4TM domain-containing protein [Cellulosilyticaceae bacterium]
MSKKVNKAKSTKSTKNTKSRPKKSQKALAPEIIGISIVGVSLFVIASIFTNQVGLVGTGIKNIFIGLFGIGGYLIPIYTIFIGWLYVRGKYEQLLESLRGTVPFIMILITSVHVLNYGSDVSISLMSLEYIKSASYLNGGWIGAAIGHLLIKLLGIWGTSIILVVALVIWILVTTEFPLFSWIQDQMMTSLGRMKEAFSAQNKVRKHNKTLEKQSKLVQSATAQEPDLEFRDESYEHPPIKIGNEESYGKPKEEEPVVIYQEYYESTNSRAETAQTEPTRVVEQRQKRKGDALSEEDKNIEIDTHYEEKPYVFPGVELLNKGEASPQGKTASRNALANAKKLEETLGCFGVEAKVLQIHKGPTVTRYELQPKQGVKVSKIVNLADDIALNLAASGIRIEAPIPGKSAVGIEVPNEASEVVYLRDVIDTDNFTAFPSKLAFALGKDIGGKPIITDIGKMPHMLIAGATGSGKSVCINTLITSILYKAKPNEVKLIMIDPKVVELNVYNGIPHLLIPVVTDPKKAAGALCWAVNEMTKRYNAFAENNVRDMKGFNNKMTDPALRMPNIVIIIDELADLMMTAAKEVEDAICRLAQMARAAGIHLVIATQRPSVDVITGVIKANIPSRLAFAVSSGIDSRTILDMNGAEKLLGKGDMLFYPVGESKPIRIQGAFISDKEVEDIVEAVKQTGEATYEEEVIQSIDTPRIEIEGSEEDELLIEAINLTKGKDKVSISMLQRYFRIGFNRASRLMEALEARGVVGPDEGSKPRKVLNQRVEERDDV